VTEASHYARASADLRRELAAELPANRLTELQRRQPVRHFAVLAALVAVLAASVAGAAHYDRAVQWVPCSIVAGFCLFCFTVMLHEVVHGAVFKGGGRANRVLGALYAFPSGISRTQFTRWHLDHHAQLGDPSTDPKRHHLSPKSNARWLKVLYMTPALFFIYFRAAAREAATYEPAVKARIARERAFTVGGQLSILAGIVALAGGWIAFKVYVVPYFLVFPVAFTLNRLGQHYDIDPSDPARWGTLMAASRTWDLAFLWSGYHLEHHYFPNVPFYNLRALHRELHPFYARRGMRETTYARLLWKWFVENRPPHADWSR
jgi:fatty acid desaturase